MNYHANENISYLQNKIFWLLAAMIVFFLAILARMYFLQVAQSQYYQTLATEIFVREEEIVAKRGLILDRHGVVLADTRPYFQITITPQYLINRSKTIASLSKLLKVDSKFIEEALEKAKYEPKFRPIPIIEDVGFEEISVLRQHMSPVYTEDAEYDFSGVAVQHIPLRQYRYPQYFSHSLGYLTEINKDKLELYRKLHPGIYSLGDLTGAAGVEQAYDQELKGMDGMLGRVVDARGREIASNEDLKRLQEQATFDPEAGLNLVTSLDFETQKIASESFGNFKGAVVAMNPKTGAVIALYSTPGFDANRITKKIDKPYWQKINLDEDKYLYNRAIQAMYPPASTYKVVALTAAIDSGKIDPAKTRFSCHGGMQFGNRFFKCWNKGGHGSLDAIHALAQSCDVFFYRVGLLLGVDGLAEYAKIFGLSAPTGIDMPFESSGLIPTKDWKVKRHEQEWYESETMSVAIGQGYNLTTTLQNAVVASLIANGGYRVIPHIGQKLVNDNNEVIKEIAPEPIKTKLFGSKALEWTRNGMIAVIHGPGTAKRLALSHYKIAGKTGTAQVIGHGSRVRVKNSNPHALFISYAPYNDPYIAVAVMVEHGRGGSAVAAPIAQKVIETYMSQFHGPF